MKIQLIHLKFSFSLSKELHIKMLCMEAKACQFTRCMNAMLYIVFHIPMAA